MLRLVLVISATSETVDGRSSAGTIVLAVAAIVVIAGLCLYLLFRRGSIADRARTDVPDVEADQSADRVEGPGPADDLSP